MYSLDREKKRRSSEFCTNYYITFSEEARTRTLCILHAVLSLCGEKASHIEEAGDMMNTPGAARAHIIKGVDDDSKKAGCT